MPASWGAGGATRRNRESLALAPPPEGHSGARVSPHSLVSAVFEKIVSFASPRFCHGSLHPTQRRRCGRGSIGITGRRDCRSDSPLPKATPAIRATPEEANVWLSAGTDDALALRRPLPDGALRIVAKGEKEDKAPSSLFDPHRHHTARVGAQKIWAGTVSIAPDAKTGVHHHGELESVIYVVKVMRGCAGASDFSSSRRPVPAT